MGWARIDDGYYDHPKVLRAVELDAGSIGLHVRAISYCAKQELNGHIPERAVCALMPLQRDREKAVAALIEVGLFQATEDGYVLHDYLDYNPSREEILEKRKRDRERKAATRG